MKAPKNISEIFLRWNDQKIVLEKQKNRVLFNGREIWWAKLGKNIGDEENGKGEEYLRPVLILKKFNTNIFYAIPLSSQIKKSNKYYLEISFKEQEISALISQMKLLDSTRLHVKMGKLSKREFEKTKSSFSFYLLEKPQGVVPSGNLYREYT